MKRLAFIFLLLALLCTIHNVYADPVPCVFTQSGSAVKDTKNLTIPLLVGNITVSPDMPNGSVVYRQNYTYSGATVDVMCNSVGTFMIERTLTSTPFSLSSWSGTPYPGKVYETGIQGLGVVIDYAFPAPTAFPMSTATCSTPSSRCMTSGNGFNFGLAIIKTGNVSAGTISGSSLPCSEQNFGVVNSGSVTVTRACFSGELNVVSQTCTTPADIPVRLGPHHISEFNGKGSGTNWVDASIQLTNCPVYYGTYGSLEAYDFSTPPGWSDTGSTTPGVPTQNKLSLQLSPTTEVIDAENFIFALDNTSGYAASGIGIQIQLGTSSAQQAIWPNYYRHFYMSPNQGSNFTIPLVARYIQTVSSTEQMHPGLANGKLVYTITYL